MKYLGVVIVAVGALSIGMALLAQPMAHASAQICTWTGGVGAHKNWSTARSWQCTKRETPETDVTLRENMLRPKPQPERPLCQELLGRVYCSTPRPVRPDMSDM